MKPIKKIAFLDGYAGLESTIEQILSKKYEIIIDSKNPDYIFYSVFGAKHIHYDCIRIFITGENCRCDFNFADYGIAFDYLIFEDRYLRYPLYLTYESFDKCLNNTTTIANPFNRSFCSFVVSNDKADSKREEIFNKLSKYKRVDSGGKYKNNIGEAVADKLEFLSKYKFNIAFENSQTNGYITEKIFDAKAAGSIPIYFGDIKIAYPLNENGGGLNKKAFINLADFTCIDEMIEFIKAIDCDEKRYLEILNEPLILDSNHKEIFNKRLENFLYNIFDSPLQEAYRRGFGQWRMNIENRYKKFQKAREKIIKIQNIIRFYK
ncbi:alpha-1,3-fucosyl transferase [Helicobacter sp. 16-1353]|uniref:glycosyltransferase family 10 domain-containing protein n=1 Tax=Helicobacter sp. 16-1353 TaxID=2004996 RepID=UPI000DCDCD3F|nr:glycosyltransferase family 10 [Helicobacter sp. 16-1353]RAX55246.1 alpha-1,3-fucosyl transferase [Helicobacter sp. 16-1353]